MITRKLLLLIYSLFISLFLWGCGASAEYTSAKMAIDKKNWTDYSLEVPEIDLTEPLAKMTTYIHNALKKKNTNNFT